MVLMSAPLAVENLVELLLELDYLPRRYLDIGCLSLGASHGLVYHDARVGQGGALAHSPAVSSTAAMLAAIPVHIVDTLGAMSCMVSYMPSPA